MLVPQTLPGTKVCECKERIVVYTAQKIQTGTIVSNFEDKVFDEAEWINTSGSNT